MMFKLHIIWKAFEAFVHDECDYLMFQVREMTLEEKKSLLFFTTGNDKAPIGGLGSLHFVIQRNDADTER